MKLTFILLTAAFIQVSAKGLGQGITFTAKNVSIETVFTVIKKQTGFTFFYNNADIQLAKPVTVDLKNTSLETALKITLENQPLNFSIEGKTVFISKKPENPNDQTTIEPNLPIDIHGRIVNDKGEPVAGASVKVKGSNKGTSTDDNGEFTLAGIDANAILVISGTNIETYEIKVNDKTDLALHVKTKVVTAEAVQIVSTGYQQLPRERATGSFVQIDNALYNRRVSADVISKLEGIVPGLLFNKNTIGSAGGGNDINIRGHSTLFSNDQPLIVVDNFAYDGDLNNLNPNDIESITVLKDAASASIWGVRSGNGVIVITTKKGKRNQKLTSELNANVTVSGKPDLFYNPNFLDANDYINIEQNLFNSGYYDGTLSRPYNLVTPVVQILADQRAGKISATDASNQINALRSQDVRNDLSKYFYRKTVAQQYALNISGGGNNSDYFLSFGYDDILANQVGNKNNRLSINSRYNYYPIKNLQFSVGINYVQTDAQFNSPLNGITRISPYTKLVSSSGDALAISTDFAQQYKDSLTNLGFLNWQYKPLEEIGLADNKTKGTDNLINLGIKYTFFQGLSAEIKYQYEKSNAINKNYLSSATYYTRNLINQFSQYSNGSFTYPIPLGGILQESSYYLTSQQIRGQINYSHTWKNVHDLAAIAGAEIRQAINESSSYTTYGYDKNTESSSAAIDFADYFSTYPSGSSKIPNSLGFSKGTNNFISYYSNAAYTYNGLYAFSVSGRIDHSNLFGVNTNQKAVPLYSAGIMWNLSKEKFYHINWLPYLKPRVTYGYNGNINTSATAILTIFKRSNSYYNGLDYATIVNPGNPELRWEKVRQVNFGIDYGLKNNIFSGSIEYYLKRGINLFGNSPLAPSTGVTTFFGNTANTKGHGIDIAINSRNIYNKNFQWTSNFIFNYVIDKVTKYDVQSTVPTLLSYGPGTVGTIAPIVGSPVYGVYSYKWAGLSPTTGDPQGYIGGKPSTDYRTIISTATFDSLDYNGPGRPTTFGSLRNTITYKQFSLSLNIIYKFNYYFRRTSTSDVSSIAAGSYGNKDYANRWQQPGDETHTNIPSIKYPPFDGNRGTFYTYSSALVDKGDNVRFEDISLSYDISKTQWKVLPFDHVQIYGYINNIGILWKANKDGLDPDLYSSAFPVPAPRTFAVGIKANF